MPEGVESLQKPEGFHGETIQYWEKKFHAVMGHLDVIHNAFDAMNYVITHVFPMVEEFNSWRMGNEAVAMESMSHDLNTLNQIKAIFNSCNSPTYWEQHLNDTNVTTLINQLVDAVNKDFNGGGFATSIIDQLKVMTLASGNRDLWENGKIKTGSYTWKVGDKTIQGTYSSYIMYMWSQEWQGKNPIPYNNYLFDLVYDRQNGTFQVFIYQNGYIDGRYYSIKTFEEWVKIRVEQDGEPVLGSKSRTASPVFLPNGQVKYWDWGKDQWFTVSKSQYVAWVISEVNGAKDSILNGTSNVAQIEIQRTPPEDEETPANPNFSTGPITQAFAAISTTLNSQSSEQQAKFKFLESNMQQYLGIDKTTMTQFVKQEENILGFMKQQSA
ncbi:MAG: hypothetical protein KDK71_07050 [Chlamydiia bacterium]|nr:hypothetical protein [Chlamydiia bacterium]